MVVLCSCNGNSKSPTTGNPKLGPEACTSARDHIAAVYKAEMPPSEDEKQKIRNHQAVEDNTRMILTDCRTDPTRFVPCIVKAKTVATLEAKCLIPLDDEGRVEGNRFRR